MRHLCLCRSCVAVCASVLVLAFHPPLLAQPADETLHRRMDRLEADITSAEDLRAIKRLQRTYGYYLDKGMWADLADLFTADAVAKYPAGTFIGQKSIRRHLFMNVGGVEIDTNGLGNNRLYNHMNIQPVVHIDADGQSATGRWRAFATFGALGGNAMWAEGIYEMGYRQEGDVWRIASLTYHNGFAAPYATGWAPPADDSPRRQGARNLAHPADEPRNMACEGFPEACVVPFHYENPSVANAGNVWVSPSVVPRQRRRTTVVDRATALTQRAELLADEQAIENLQRIYGYYFDRADWDQVADLFANDATIEMGLRGVYEGKARVREFLDVLGPAGLREGQLNDHWQVQIIVDVSADGMTAKSRSRQFNMTGQYLGSAQWSEGIFTNTFVKENGVWKYQSLRYYPTFITDYDKGWAEDAQPAPTASRTQPPDRAPTDSYEIYPAAHIPPFHYSNPVTGVLPRYPVGDGRPSRRAIRSAQAPLAVTALQAVADVTAALDAAEEAVFAYKDYHELENLHNIYGYYLDKNLWNDLADLFADEGSMELAQRGVYHGRERVRSFLFEVFGDEGPVAGRLGNHIQLQPVISLSEDRRTAKIRSRMLQQLTFGPRPSMGAAVYEDEAIKENGVWKLSKVHAFNTWTASYDGGWARNPGTRVPGPSESFAPDAPPSLSFTMFPNIYEIPYHYDNPVSARPSNSPALRARMSQQNFDGFMPPEIAAQLREIGRVIEPEKTAAIYLPLHAGAAPAVARLARDLSYGPHERHVLDIFSNVAAGQNRPVVVFVHGGGFTVGAKSSAESPFYDNVMYWAANEQFVAVNINYRLAPDNRWPAGVEDVERVIDWLRNNISDYGGDPESIVLWGHSAGAAHVADYLAATAKNARDANVAGAILLSGFYDLGDQVSTWQAYYGDDVSTYPERSSLPGLLVSDTPLMVVDAALDPESFNVQADLLTGELTRAGRQHRRLHLAGHSHISEGFAIGTTDRSLTNPVRAFIQSVTNAE